MLAPGFRSLAGRLLAGLALFPLMPFAAPAEARGAAQGAVALTFDDLPELSLVDDQAYAETSNRRLLATLKRHRIKAIGFVVTSKLEEMDRARQTAILTDWLDAGMDLGNHTNDHGSPNTMGAQAYVADIATADPILRTIMAPYGKAPRWFRHPYLETGSPAATKADIDEWLAEHHYRIAPVTIDADDWEFAEPYDDALSHNHPERAAQIRREYLAYTARMVAWYQRGAHALFGRDIAHVMLLHASRLNADSLEQVIALLHHAGLKTVSLDTAMADPAYTIPDPYTGKDGIEWLERWSQALKKPLPWASFQDVPKDIAADYHRVDPD